MKTKKSTLKTKKGKTHLAWIIPLSIAGGLIAIAVGGAIVNKDKFWNSTYISDHYVGGMTVAEASDFMDSHKVINLKTNDGNESIALSDIDYKASYTDALQKIKDSQSPFLWFAHLTDGKGSSEYTISPSISYDEDKLKNIINKLDCVTNKSLKDPVDAHLSVENGKVTIADAVPGNKIDTDKLLNLLKKDLSEGKTDIDLANSDCYQQPKVQSDDPELVANYNKVKNLSATITIDLEAGDTVTLGPETYLPWLETKGTEVILNDPALTKYVSDLAKKYNTYGSERKFKTSKHGTITVGGKYSDISGNDSYGFLMNQPNTYDILSKAILDGKDTTVKVDWKLTAKQRNGINEDIGNTYVEIDVTDQHMWYYVDGKLYTHTDVRTGTESSKQYTPTPSGVYNILSKSRDKYFRGFEPVVHSDYWMPFDWRGDGIHDAEWYSTYGGSLYKYSGSHGCINTPYSIVKKMYEHMKVGTPVIVYRSSKY